MTMTSNELVAKEINKCELPEVPTKLKKLITNAKRKKFYFPNAEKTLKDVDLLYLLDKKSHENICMISSKFLVAGFTLNYLKAINEVLEKKYKFPQLTLIDFIDEDKLEQIRQGIIELKNEPLIDWLKEECLEELKDAVEDINADNIEKLVELGQIINLSQKELSFEDSNEEIEIYDIGYRYLNRLDDFGLRGAKHDYACEIGSIKRISNGETTEITLECKGDRKARKEFEGFFWEVGKEFIRKK